MLAESGKWNGEHLEKTKWDQQCGKCFLPNVPVLWTDDGRKIVFIRCKVLCIVIHGTKLVVLAMSY